MELLNESGLYALAGAALTAIPAAIATWHAAVRVERAKLQQILIQASKDAWIERSKLMAQCPPLEHQMLYTTLMAELCADIHRLDDDAVRTRMQRIHRLIGIVTKQAPIIRTAP